MDHDKWTWTFCLGLGLGLVGLSPIVSYNQRLIKLPQGASVRVNGACMCGL